MRRFLYDTSVFVFALGGEHRYRKPCRRVLELAARGELAGEASADLVQEFAHQRLRQTGDRGEAARSARDVAGVCRLHDVRIEDALGALDAFERSPRLAPGDAVFAALAARVGIDAILSADRDFDRVEGLERIDPADEMAVRALGASG